MLPQLFPQLPGVYLTRQSDLVGARWVRCLNKSGGNLVAGTVVILDTTVANLVRGALLPVKTTTSGTDKHVLGVVGDQESTIPDGAECWVQVAGLHPAVLIDGTTDITAGDAVGTFTTAGQGAKVTDGVGRVGYYCDANYTTDAVAAAKKVFLVNPLGIA